MPPPRPLGEIGLIAHRGASAYRPENTMPAFRLALDLGARAVEFDVQQTADEELVVLHDTDLRRTAGLRRAVGDMTCAELGKVDVGSRFPGGSGERVPRLSEVMALVGGLEVHLEIKQPRRPYPRIEERVSLLLNSRPGWRDNTVVSSFNFRTLERLRALDPDVRLAWIAVRPAPAGEIARARGVGAEAVHLSRRLVGPAWTREAARAGMKVRAYTVNTVAELRRLAAAGVDAVFTNFPDLLRREEAAA